MSGSVPTLSLPSRPPWDALAVACQLPSALPCPPRCVAGNQDDEALQMAFSKKKVEDRKQWLQGYRPGTFLDHTADTISYSSFVHKVGRRAGRRGAGRTHMSCPCSTDECLHRCKCTGHLALRTF